MTPGRPGVARMLHSAAMSPPHRAVAAMLFMVTGCRSPDDVPLEDAARLDVPSRTDAALAPDNGAVDGESSEVVACVSSLRGPRCPYRGYGTTCTVPCDQPLRCVFQVTLEWYDGYCCGFGMETFTNCSCVEGQTLCRNPAIRGDTGQPPTTYCEFCRGEGGSRVSDGGPPHDGG